MASFASKRGLPHAIKRELVSPVTLMGDCQAGLECSKNSIKAEGELKVGPAGGGLAVLC